MEKIRLSLSGADHDFARLYNWSGQGFRGDRAAISFPSHQSLTLFFISERHYQLVIEGEATLSFDSDVGSDLMRFYSVCWSDFAKRCGKGSATVKIVNSDFPNEPLVIDLTLGEFNYDHASTWTGEKTIGVSVAGLFGLHLMLAQETAYAAASYAGLEFSNEITEKQPNNQPVDGTR